MCEGRGGVEGWVYAQHLYGKTLAISTNDIETEIIYLLCRKIQKIHALTLYSNKKFDIHKIFYQNQFYMKIPG